jgi:hypothetical protein
LAALTSLTTLTGCGQADQGGRGGKESRLAGDWEGKIALGASGMDSANDLIRRNRELLALAAIVREEAKELRASYVAIWGRSLDLLPRIRATWSETEARRMKRQPSHNSVDSAIKRWSDGSSSANGRPGR